MIGLCPFEVLHFLPALLIALSFIGARKSGVLFHLAMAALSVAGVLAGAHSHAEHGAFFGVVDPCWMYGITLAVSVFQMVRFGASRFARN
jgi:hypothetical protein